MSKKSTSSKKVDSGNEFFLKVIKLDNEFANLINKAREDIVLPLSPDDPDAILKEKEKKLFYWIGVIQNVYNLPVQWSVSLWKYITEGLLPDPGIGISYNAQRAITSTENRFEPLQILIYEKVSIKNIKEWLDLHKREINYHLFTLPHKRRIIENSELALEILRMHLKDKTTPTEIAVYYENLDLNEKDTKDKKAIVTAEYVSNIIYKYKKALGGLPFYKSSHKKS